MVKYEINDKVVFRYDGKNEIGVITNIRYLKKKLKGYDIRSEKGSGYIIVPVDKPQNKYAKSYPIIDSKLTEAWIGSDSSTNLFAHENNGHTRANYSKNIPLHIDGEKSDDGQFVQQIEKYNDFIFPTIGPRSY